MQLYRKFVTTDSGYSKNSFAINRTTTVQILSRVYERLQKDKPERQKERRERKRKGMRESELSFIKMKTRLSNLRKRDTASLLYRAGGSSTNEYRWMMETHTATTSPPANPLIRLLYRAAQSENQL